MSNSVEAVPILSTSEDRLSPGLASWQGVALLMLIACLYAPILARLFLQWVGPNSDPNFQHGIFVPLFALFVLWQDRKKLRAISAHPSWAGLPLIVLSLLTLVLGILGAEIFLQRGSLLILLAGLIILFQGWTFFRAVLFPWAVLILMIPPPTLIMQHITFPLQILASKLATVLLRLVGVPVLREGNMLTLAAMPLDVAEACSGIRSLLTLVTLAIIYGYLMETRKWVRVLLVCLAIPIAVLANSFRVFGTGLLVQYVDTDAGQGFFHEFEGWLIFVVALIMLFAAHRLISFVWKRPPVTPHDPASVSVQQVDERPEVRAKAWSLRFGIGAGLLLATAIGLQAHSHNEVFPPREPLSSLPAQIDGWTGTDIAIDQQTLDILGPGEFLLRDYARESQPPAPPVNLYLAYFPTQRAGDTIHSPNHCLPGSGWIPTSKQIIQLKGPDGRSFPVNRDVVSKLGDRQLVLYWFQAHGREVASEFQAKYYLISDSIQMNRSDGALVRLMTPMRQGESADAAQARIMTLGSQIIPLLDNYIPR
jgi:exosortase D (VPLPA-CTERM-specific)